MPELFPSGGEIPGATVVLDRPETQEPPLTGEQIALLDILTDEPVQLGLDGTLYPAITDFTGRVIGADRTRPLPPKVGGPESFDPVGDFFDDLDFYSTQQRLERGVDAAEVVGKAADRFLIPLVRALSGNPRLRPRIEALLYDGTELTPDRPRRFTINPSRMGRTRALGIGEEEYLTIVKDITEVNPYLVAAGAVEPDIAHAVLRSEFDRRSARTRQEVPKGSSLPMVVIGAGIHGTIAAGSTLIQRPDVLENTLFLDRAATPGGVFALANGEAHRVNSANRVGTDPFPLPPRITDGTVDLEQGIFPNRPGERPSPGDPRRGSINTLVPFFPAPDDLDPSNRYVTNHTFALAAKLQDSLLMRRFRGETGLLRVEPNPAGPDEFRVISRDLRSGELFDVTTSNLVLSVGMSKARRAVERNAYYDEMVDEQQKLGEDYFPLICDTVEAYQCFADRTRGQVRHGSRFAIVGSGDSAATLVEALTGLFKTGNLGPIEKITIVASSPLSERCRYKSIDDLKERFESATGRKNVLEIVNGRVTGANLYYDPRDRAIQENPIVLTGNGLTLRDAQGTPLQFDHVIESVGFESELAEILAPLLDGRPLENSLSDVVARSNPLFVVGQVLAKYPGILLVGTAAQPKFDDEKLRALPRGTQEVVRIVGENVVSIGARGGETTIALKEWLRTRRKQLPDYRSPEREALMPPMFNGGLVNDTFTVPFAATLPPVDRKLEPNADLLTPLLLLPFSTRELMQEDMVDVTPADPAADASMQPALFGASPIAERQFGARIQFVNGKVQITPQGSMPMDMVREIAEAAMDPHFQAYGQVAMQQRRSDAIDVRLTYKGTQLDLTRSLVQAA